MLLLGKKRNTVTLYAANYGHQETRQVDSLTEPTADKVVAVIGAGLPLHFLSQVWQVRIRNLIRVYNFSLDGLCPSQVFEVRHLQEINGGL